MCLRGIAHGSMPAILLRAFFIWSLPCSMLVIAIDDGGSGLPSGEGQGVCATGADDAENAASDIVAKSAHVLKSLLQHTFGMELRKSSASINDTDWAPDGESVTVAQTSNDADAERPPGGGRSSSGKGKSAKTKNDQDSAAGTTHEEAHEEEEHAHDRPLLARLTRKFSWKGMILFCSVFGSCFFYITFLLFILYGHYRRQHSGRRWSFGGYLVYRFGQWFQWSPHSTATLLIVIFASFVFLGAFSYCVFTQTSIVKSSWKIFIWLVSPDAGQQEYSVAGAVIGGLVSLGGLLIFALLLALVQDSMTKYLDKLRNGNLPVRESGHVVLVGFTSETIPVLRELSMAFESRGGVVIAILAEEPIAEVEKSIRGAADLHLGKSNVVVRSGQAHDVANLRHVAVDTCSAVILMPDPRMEDENRDAFVLRILIVLCGQGWPMAGRVVVTCSVRRNRTLFEQMGGVETHLAMPRHILAKLMVRASRQWGLGTVIKTTFSFDGSEFYIATVPDRLVGHTFEEAAFHYPESVLCGILTTQGYGRSICGWSPERGTKLKAKDELVLLAQQESGTYPKKEACIPPVEQHKLFSEVLEHSSGVAPIMRMLPGVPTCTVNKPGEPETIFFLGWNNMIGLMLPEVDLIVPPQSVVLIFSPTPAEEREARLERFKSRWSRPLQNVARLQHVEKQLGSRTTLEDLPVPIESASRIFVLADEGAPSIALADACTVTTILQIYEILFARGCPEFMPIIPEIRDPITMKYCTFAKISDFVDSTSVCAQILAMVAFQPRIMTVLEDIVAEEGEKEFCIRGFEDYLDKAAPMPSRISFFQAWAIAHVCGDVVLGWSKPFEEVVTPQQSEPQGVLTRSMSHYLTRTQQPSMTGWEQSQVDRISQRISSGTLAQWEMNPPDKHRLRRWVVGQDKLVVVSRSTLAGRATPNESASSLKHP